MDSPRVALEKYFGFREFREGQESVIASILERRDTVGVMPTGSGKSLCYQLPALMLEGATIVVSPLIALMKDQVDALDARGLPATFINSSLDYYEQRERLDGLRRGRYKMIYIAPERFRNRRFLDAIRGIEVAVFAIDEAHCISEWGHDFRPDYLRLREAADLLGRPPLLALTATATPDVRTDIIRQLGIDSARVFVSGFDRPNLSIVVRRTEREREKIALLTALARSHAGSGIVYAATRTAVEEVAEALQDAGVAAVPYHAGLDDRARRLGQERFMAGDERVIVATNAFGMGIDKRDIRFVAHYQMPGSIEAYYQEIGRAGRDGQPATCLLLFNYADKRTHDYFIDGSYPPIEVVRNVYRALVHVGTERVTLSTSEIARRAETRNEMAVRSALIALEKAGHLRRVDSDDRRRGAMVLEVVDRVPEIRVNANELTIRAGRERRQLRELIRFCYAETCFRAYILDYFGDRNRAKTCGTCSNCDTSLISRDEGPGAQGAELRKKSPLARAEPRALSPEPLSADERNIRIRKILACAARMKGRFGKNMLAATLRGAKLAKLTEAQLDQLSTYGILRNMTQDEILGWIDALVSVQCLEVSGGRYPVVSITAHGREVMHERASVDLEVSPSAP
ncbi:MAG TPA: ATP-dependent DNA helicase RecQ [Thermoanaerobaculia bacterium]